MRFTLKLVATCAALACASTVFAQQGETIKIAMIEGLSGPMGNVGTNQLKSWQYVAGQLTPEENPAGVKFEIVPMDSKSSPQEALNLLKSAIDQGIHYVTQGNGSNVAIPLADAVGKNNSRNPGQEVLYMNYAAVDPASTNEKCNYWHFRFDADTTMKMKALAAFVATQPVEKVYLMNQNYSHGHQVSKYFKEFFAQDKADAKIVGDDYVALGQVKDFAPYVAKMKDSGADAVVTGSWGQDFTLMVKAMNDAGLHLPIYAYYAGVSGTPTALGQGGDEVQVYQVAYGHSGYKDNRTRELMDGFQAQYKDDYYTFAAYNALVGLSHAMAKAGSTNPVKVAPELEGLKFTSHNGDTVEMRADDHQLQQGLWISKWQKADADNTYNVENTGHNFAPVKFIDIADSTTPTTCDMKRPG